MQPDNIVPIDIIILIFILLLIALISHYVSYTGLWKLVYRDNVPEGWSKFRFCIFIIALVIILTFFIISIL